jgi:hypothetical protein
MNQRDLHKRGLVKFFDYDEPPNEVNPGSIVMDSASKARGVVFWGVRGNELYMAHYPGWVFSSVLYCGRPFVATGETVLIEGGESDG